MSSSSPEPTSPIENLSQPDQVPTPEDDGVPEYEPLTPELVEEEAIRGDFVLMWAVVLLAFLMGSTRIGETMTLVHVKTGQYLASHGILPPRTDVFSYTATERPWVNLNWGFDLLVAAAHGLGGFAGVSALKGLIAAAAFVFLVHIYRPNLPTWWGAICAALALVAYLPRLTAQPTIMTLLGISITLWILDAWRRENCQGNRLWCLPPLFLIWGNCDPRMFLGFVLLVSYAVGDVVGSRLKAETALKESARRQLCLTIGVTFVASMANPFFWNAPWGMLLIYGSEYPGFHDAVQGFPSATSLPYFSLATAEFWLNLNLPATAGLFLLLAAGVLFVWNRKKLEWSQVFVYAGFVIFACLATHELPIAAVVCATLAALNGQDWYAANCRRTYTVEMKELIFSRGGRALTVAAFAALAVFDIAGRLRDPLAPRTGFGLDQRLSATLDDLDRQLKDGYGRAFTFVPAQGDMLIWLGYSPFIDSRISIYHGAGDNNLVALFTRTRSALRAKRNDLPGSGDRAFWQKVFDKYEVTHAVPRLTTGYSPPDYFTLFDLMRAEEDWQLTSYGSATFVYYRADKADDPELTKFRNAHRIDFSQLAYKTPAELVTGRDKWISPPSFYDTWLWRKRRDLPNEVLEAHHLVRIAAENSLSPAMNEARPALVFMAIRRAQAGLVRVPDSVEGYLVLGNAYSLLSQWETESVLPNRSSPRLGLRYFQAAAAYGQALTGDPANVAAHAGAYTLYETAGKFDLALREREYMNKELIKRTPRTVDEVTEQQRSFRMQEELERIVKQVRQELAKLSEDGASALQLAQYAEQRGCIGEALHYLTKNPETLKGNLEMQRMQTVFLLQAGHAETAYEAAGLMEEPARMANLPRWREAAALAFLANAEYKRAWTLWNESAEETEKNSLGQLLFSLWPQATAPTLPWPMAATAASEGFLYQRPDTLATLRLNMALVQLEAGQLPEAITNFEAVLELDPEHASRPLIAYQLQQLTGKDVEMLPPSEWIPLLFEREEGEKAKGEKGEE